MDRRKFLRTAAGLFVPLAPAIIRPDSVWAQMSGGAMFPGPGVKAYGAASTGLRTNCVAFFELNNSLADSTGTVTDLTNNNSVTFTTDTPGGTGEQCAVFASASSQSLSHANNSNFAIGGADFSYCIWVKKTGGSLDGGRLMNQRTNGFPQNGWRVGTQFTSGSIMRSSSWSGATEKTSDSVATISTSTWYMVVWTYDATTKVGSQSLSNSAFVDAAAQSANPSSETGQFNIGVDDGLSSFADARVCRVGFWKNRKLNTTDVGLLWNSGGGLTWAGMA
jgi:hypothetical protein